MHLYEQLSGRFVNFNGELYTGYSGHGEGLNNPDKEALRAVGPIPKGHWLIKSPRDSATLGPCVLDLEPIFHNALGRSLFRIHGDNPQMNKSASDGCVILGPVARNSIANSPCKILRVM